MYASIHGVNVFIHLKEKTPFADLGASAGRGALHLLP